MNRKVLLCLAAMSMATLTVGANSNANYQSAAGSIITSEFSNMASQQNNWLSRTTLAISFQQHWKPMYTVETVQPLTKYDATSDHVVFAQGRLSNQSDIGTTANVGIGYRYITNNDTTMYGANTFFDYGFKEKHERMGFGLEYLHNESELRANIYKGLSGAREVDTTNHIFEKVVDGYDVEYASTFKNAAYAKAYINAYHWNFKHTDDSNGVRMGAQVQLTPRVSVDVGYNKASHEKGEAYGQVMYRLTDTKVALWNGKHSNEQESTVRSKMLDKVRRNNNIIVERYGNKDTVKSTKIHYSIKVL